MAVLDLRELPEGSTRVDRSLSSEVVGLSLDEMTAAEPILLTIDVARTGGSLELRGRIRGVAHESCSRCAESFERAFDESFLFFATPAQDGDDADTSEDDDLIFHDGRSIDLCGRVRELVLISAPMAPVCHAECKGLCPICGANQNQTRCDCKRCELDPRWQVIRDHLNETRSGGK